MVVALCVFREVRRLIIPPHLAYGDSGAPGAIPGQHGINPVTSYTTYVYTVIPSLPVFVGGATLEFEIELLDIKKKPYFSTPQLTGFSSAFLVVGVVGVAVYELYKRANKQGAELRDSKKRERESRRGGKGRRKKE